MDVQVIPPSYYFANGAEQRGPFTLEELAGFGLRPDTLVWREGMLDWQRADSIPGLLSIPAPASDNAQSTLPPIVQPVLQYCPPQSSSNGLAVASLVLGIVSIPGLCVYGGGALLGVLAIVFGCIARSRARREGLPNAGMAIAGIACGAVSAGLVVALIVVGLILALTT